MSDPRWPATLPRFAESFRICIEHPTYPEARLMTGEWEMAEAWPRTAEARLPLLALAGQISIIASTAPRYYRGFNLKEWYGDENYPVVVWHPDYKGGLRLATTEETIVKWCQRRGIARELFDKPRFDT